MPLLSRIGPGYYIWCLNEQKYFKTTNILSYVEPEQTGYNYSMVNSVTNPKKSWNFTSLGHWNSGKVRKFFFFNSLVTL